MELFFRTFGEGKPLVIMHGLFGSSDNWQTVGKVLAKQRKVYLVDLPNHGQSPHSEDFTYDAMANELANFIQHHNLGKPDLLGHSMGGKTAMQYAKMYPEGFNKMIVVDIAPKAYPVRHQSIIEGLSAIDIDNLTSRQKADQVLSEYVNEAGVRQFLLKNLARKAGGGFQWKVNLPIIAQKIEQVGVSQAGESVSLHPVLFIGGGASDYIRIEDQNSILRTFPRADILMVDGAGHWVHATHPQALIDAVESFLND